MAVDDLLTTKQVCDDYPAFNPGTLRFWRSTNQGPASFSLGRGGRVVYRRSEIERWLAEQEQATKRGGTDPVAHVDPTGEQAVTNAVKRSRRPRDGQRTDDPRGAA